MIQWKGSPNYSSRKGHVPIAIVYHIMEGTLLGTHSWLHNKNSGVSYHYGIGKDGEIFQWVDEDNAAWHAGIVETCAWELYDGINPNYQTVGIACEGYSGDPFSEKMIESLVWLSKDVAARWGIPATDDILIGHFKISGTRRANCPGPTFPWDRLMKELKKNEVKKDEIPQWKKDGLAFLRDNGLITSDYWQPDDPIDMGTLGVILSNVTITGRKC